MKEVKVKKRREIEGMTLKKKSMKLNRMK